MSISSSTLVSADLARGRGIADLGGRTALALATLAFVTGGVALATLAAPAEIDPDLARLLRFMALLKGAFAFAGFAAGYWRLARPAAPWRSAVYILAPGLMAGGAIGLYGLQAAGLSTLVLHAGLLGMLAAALTDRDFIPDFPRNRVRV